MVDHSAGQPAIDGTHTPRPRLDTFRGWAIAASLAVVVFLALPWSLGWLARIIAGWDAGLLVLLARWWWVMARANVDQTRVRAAAEDPGSIGVVVIALVASAVSLAAAAALLPRAGEIAPGRDRLIVALGVAAVAGAWVLMQTTFSLHYARLYYDDAGSSGGLDFAGGLPDDLDFAYFAFGIGMTYQVADVAVSRRAIRRTVLLHALLSFIFNTIILALVVSLLLGRLG